MFTPHLFFFVLPSDSSILLPSCQKNIVFPATFFFFKAALQQYLEQFPEEGNYPFLEGSRSVTDKLMNGTSSEASLLDEAFRQLKVARQNSARLTRQWKEENAVERNLVLEKRRLRSELDALARCSAETTLKIASDFTSIKKELSSAMEGTSQLQSVVSHMQSECANLEHEITLLKSHLKAVRADTDQRAAMMEKELRNGRSAATFWTSKLQEIEKSLDDVNVENSNLYLHLSKREARKHREMQEQERQRILDAQKALYDGARRPIGLSVAE